MEAQKFIIRYGCNDFVFEGYILDYRYMRCLL